ncbi:MAG: GNAT family N-acetyltransferase [Candidatus Heimdallarchaeota archaeon]|nr:GNAT family N-acetyltransferase [Candidatus Heimdallarchaeota archaeon]MDH5644605.1 GNAT family N-acetyltransferase [Candidatus Heimdallarchaeota archaeon]
MSEQGLPKKFIYKRDYLDFILVELACFEEPMTRVLIDFLLSKYGNEFWWVIDINGDGKNDGHIAAGVDKENSVHIFTIAVKTEHQGQGYGSLLLQTLIEQSKRQKLRYIVLEVNENNLNAVKLYRSFGFYSVKILEHYYNNLDNAILMKLDI